jgi:hypothetical protein
MQRFKQYMLTIASPADLLYWSVPHGPYRHPEAWPPFANRDGKFVGDAPLARTLAAKMRDDMFAAIGLLSICAGQWHREQKLMEIAAYRAAAERQGFKLP